MHTIIETERVQVETVPWLFLFFSFFLFFLICSRQDDLHDSSSRPGGHRGGGASSVPAWNPSEGVSIKWTLLVLQPQDLQWDLLPQTQTGISIEVPQY